MALLPRVNFQFLFIPHLYEFVYSYFRQVIQQHGSLEGV